MYKGFFFSFFYSNIDHAHMVATCKRDGNVHIDLSSVHIFFCVIKRKSWSDHITSSEEKQSNVDFAVASANFAGRPSTVVSVDFAARPSAVASADFAGRPSTVVSTYFTAGIFFRLQMMQLFFIYNQSLLMVIGWKSRAYKLQDLNNNLIAPGTNQQSYGIRASVCLWYSWCSSNTSSLIAWGNGLASGYYMFFRIEV